MDPPKGALVLCIDEKTQIQALDRTQPTLPMKPGKAARMTHDYKRNGTTSLYAALEIATGEVTGACYPQHRHQEFLAFLNQIVRAYPRRPLHVVLDNSSTHSTPRSTRWLQRHKRVHFHFTPTSASWMNMVEIWFSILTKQQVRRGVYHDVPELIAAIEMFIEGYNERAQPFVWTKTADDILTKTSQTTRHFRNAALVPIRVDLGFLRSLPALTYLVLAPGVRHAGPQPSPLDPPFGGLSKHLSYVRAEVSDPDTTTAALTTHLGSDVGAALRPLSVVDELRGTWVLHALVLVGPPGKGRKGSSWDHVETVLGHADPELVEERIVSGTSSGEASSPRFATSRPTTASIRTSACSCSSPSPPG